MSKSILELEYEFKASPNILYDFITNPSNIAQWFADHCDVTGDRYSFFWNGYEEIAIADDYNEGEFMRWVWEDEPDKIIEFRLSKADITNSTILIIQDHVDEDEMEDQRMLWDSQIKTLRSKVGG